VSLSSASAGGSSQSRPSRLPVLEPSTFPIATDDATGWTVVQRRHRSSVSLKDFCSDPNYPRISKNELLGSFVKFNNNKACAPGRPN
jgi:hypothetical protein